jgi:murein DD-endopeptidase MepM/ murein hydrolase activator NlpD
MQAALVAARQRLADARTDFARGRATVARQRGDVAAYAVSSASTQFSQLSTLNLVMNANSTTAAISQVQGANSAVAKQLTDLQRLQANQTLLQFTKQRIEAAAVQVAADRRRAAANLAAKRVLEARATAAEATVQERVTALQTQQHSLAAAKTAELSRIDTLERERAHLAERLQRIAAAEAAAAARRAAAQKAAAARAAAQKAAAARAAAQRAAQGSTSSGGTSSTSTLTSGGYLSMPVRNSYITSPYGMRMHPILHIWKLHDGTDFHAPCGTPVYAAADGTVLEEYYNTGYGNRVILNHGYVRGVSLMTSYNHLTSFVAHTGEHVSRGQLIAYSGTTGYSTACHLHFMVYVNGTAVDPMTWL